MCIRDSISADKLNQLRHVRFLPTIEAVKEHMKKHAESLRPRFEAVERKLTEGLGDTGCATWTHPRGGYFVSFDGPEGSAQKVAALCADLGVKLTPAGATWPYGKDPRDTNIRIAPSYPTVEDLSLIHILIVAPGSQSSTYQHSVLPRLPFSCSAAYSSLG